METTYISIKWMNKEDVVYQWDIKFATKQGDGRTGLKICSKKARSSGVYGIKKKESGLSDAWRVGKGNWERCDKHRSTQV